MNKQPTVFSQIMNFLPEYQFKKCVQKYNGNYRVRSFTCMDQFLCMAFAQLAYRESLRDIEACLNSQKNKLYQMGIRVIYHEVRLHIPTKIGTGASMLILRKFL